MVSYPPTYKIRQSLNIKNVKSKKNLKMKTTKTILFGTLATFLLAGCQKDDQGPSIDSLSGETTQVQFELDASSFMHNPITRAYTPTYNTNGFSIYAFKQSGTDYLYQKTINLDNMSYSTETNKLTGTDIIPIGFYKFLAVYGLNNQTSYLTAPNWGSTPRLANELNTTYNGTGALSEIFMQTDMTEGSLLSYPMGITEESNPTVTATLKRAVSRVDILFIKASKDAEGVYTEQPYKTGANALGGKTISNLEFEMTNLNNTMSLFGVVPTGSTFNGTIAVKSPANSTVIGNAEATSVGTSTYNSYNDIQPTDIIKGGAHITGNYFIPNMDNAKNSAFKLHITSTDGVSRTINVSTDADKYLPLERNKVTIVKVYILDDPDDDDDDDDPDVFNTKVTFDVQIDTDWLNSNEVIGEIE